MKHNVSKKIISLLLACIMLVGLLPSTALTAHAATNVGGTYFASNFVDGDALVLIEDTTIFVNKDITLRSISGDYALEIQSDGEHTLTVDNPNGSAVYVKTLKSAKPSQGTVNLTIKGGDDYFAIATTGDISLAGIKLDVNGSAGIRSTEGNVIINGTNVSVVGNDGIGVVANSGSISIDSDYLFVQCAGQSGDAMWEHGIGAAKDVTIISDDATIAGSIGIESDKGNITLNGNIAVGGTGTAVYAVQGTITMTGAVTAQGGDDYFAIGAKGDISFDGTKLDAKGGAGIRSEEGNVTINGTNVLVVGSDGIGVVANSGSISIDSDYLFVQCAGQSGDAYWEHGIGAAKDVTIISDDATIAGLYGISSDTGNVTLNGNIAVGGQRSAVTADEGTIAMTGAVTAQSGDGYFAIAAKGNVSFDGTKLDAKGSSGIRSAEGNVTINGTNVSVVGSDGIGVVANNGSISIDSDYLFVQCAGQSGDAYWEHGIGAAKDVTIISDDAIIAGRYGVASDEGNISLTGTFWIGARKSAICATAGNITVNGDLTANNTDGNYYCVVSGEGDITLSDGTFNITSASNAVITHNGNIYLNGDITVSSSEADSCAINAREGDIVIQGGSLDVTTGGTYALGAANGNIEITQPLQILVPQNGHVDTNNVVANGSIIVDANGDPVSHVEIATVITDEINVWINAPVGGEKPLTSPEDVYGLNSDCTVKSITWYENDVKFNGSNFIAGESYKVEIVLSAKDGYVFQADISGKINGNTASTGTSNGCKEMVLTYSFSNCPAVIKNVALTVTAPLDGNTISYSVTDESSAYSVPGNSNYVRWYVSDDGTDYTLMTSGDKFVGGKYYKVEMEVMTHSGYEFALKDVGTIQPDVSATVNGYEATVVKTYEQDPSENITVQYNFGICNDTIIENIEILNVTAPVAGEKPRYTYSISGSGYQMNTSKNAYYDDWQNDRKLYYIKNGIGWVDVTDGGFDWVYENDTFLPGHEYQVQVYLKTEDGYTFAHDKYLEMLFTATVNGQSATGSTTTSDGLYNQTIKYSFGVCQPVDIVLVMMSNIDEPQANKTPDYDITVAHSDFYMTDANYGENGIMWYDSEGNFMAPTDTFRQGEQYKLEIKLVPVKVDGVNMCKFVSPVTAYINGQVVTERNDWDAVYSNANAVYVYYTFINGASAPDEISVNGSITSYGDSSSINIELRKINGTSAAYSTTVTGNNITYSIPNVESGTYELIVTKAGHVTYHDTFIAYGEDVVRDIELNLYADTNLDGEIDENDYQALVNAVLQDDHEQIETAEYDDLIHYDLVMDGYLDVLDAAVMALVVNGHKTIDEVYDLQKGDYDLDGEAYTESDLIAMYHVLSDIDSSAPTLSTSQKFASDLNYNGKVDEEDLNKLVSIYGEIEETTCEENVKVYYRWGNSYSTCTATAICTICDKHVAKETVNSVKNADGSYTATFTNTLLGTKTYSSK